MRTTAQANHAARGQVVILHVTCALPEAPVRKFKKVAGKKRKP